MNNLNEKERQAIIEASEKYSKLNTKSRLSNAMTKADFIAGAEFLAELRKQGELLSAQMFLAGKLEAEKDSVETIADLRSALGDIQGEMTDKAMAFAEWYYNESHTYESPNNARSLYPIFEDIYQNRKSK